MKCNETRELMPDLAAGLTAVTPEMKAHLDACAECAGKLEAFRQTMSLLDEWQAPEPSPYFDVRLRARLREIDSGERKQQGQPGEEQVPDEIELAELSDEHDAQPEEHATEQRREGQRGEGTDEVANGDGMRWVHGGVVHW